MFGKFERSRLIYGFVNRPGEAKSRRMPEYIEVQIKSDKIGMSLIARSEIDGFEIEIPLEGIADDLKKVLKK